MEMVGGGGSPMGRLSITPILSFIMSHISTMSMIGGQHCHCLHDESLLPMPKYWSSALQHGSAQLSWS
jgi:hypothetical protein